MKNGRKTALILMSGGVFLGTNARLYIIVAHTDMKTGFLNHGEALLCNLIYYGILIAVSVGAALAVRQDNAESPPAPGSITDRKCGFIGFPVLFSGIFAAYEGYREFSALSRSGFLVTIDLLFGAAMVIIAFVTLSKKEFTPPLGYSYSFIGVYCTLKGMYCFISRMAITTIPEYLIEVLSLIGMILFFVLFARLMSGNTEKYTYTGLCFWGTFTSGITLSSSFATMLASVTAPEEIRRRIALTTYDAELFRQQNKGVDAYKLTFTPWVQVALGITVFMAVLLLLIRKESAESASKE